jgi:two-component system, LytTR family, sensor kinase
MSTPKPVLSRPWLSIALLWLCLGLVHGTQIVVGMRAVGMQHQWTALFTQWTFAWLVWACATPIVLSLGRRFPPTRATRWQGWSIHLAACTVLAIADACWIAALEFILHPMGWNNPHPAYSSVAFTILYERFHVDMITYAAILAAGHMVDSLKRLSMRDAEAARLSAELSKAQLDALRRQMEPHFLFNTLNGIAGLVRDHQNDNAVEMIAGLSDLLRRVVEGSDRQMVPLAEELSFLERYVEIQIMRFGDRLNVVIDVPLELYGAMVPNLILQPMVENAIQHGIGACVKGGTIRVTASVHNGVLDLTVHNDGPPLPSGSAPARPGVGISNTRGRLHSLYGDAGAVEVRNHALAGVETIVSVPFHLTAP